MLIDLSTTQRRTWAHVHRLSFTSPLTVDKGARGGEKSDELGLNKCGPFSVIAMSMSSTNASVRSLRDKFQQQQQVNQYGNRTNARQDQKHDVLFQCIHCGTHQTISLVAQWPLTKGLYRPHRSTTTTTPRSLAKFYVQAHLDIEINAPVRRIYPRSLETRQRARANSFQSSLAVRRRY